MTPRLKIATSLLVVVVLHGCATAAVKTPGPQPIRGVASWYGEEFAGRVTASGDIFDPFDLTAAHPALPFGTIANVTNMSNGATVQVRINDRGPYIGNRIIDLSYAAAQKIGLIEPGIGMIELTIISLGDGRYRLDPSLKAQKTKDDDEPPSVSFPLPDQVGSQTPTEVMTEDDDFEIEVIEERRGTPMRRRVSADGRELEMVPMTGSAPDPTPVPPPAPAPPTVTTNYILQLGAFQNHANAEALRQKVARLVPRVYLEQSEGFHRVRIGPFDSRERALQVQEQLLRADLPSVLLTE